MHEWQNVVQKLIEHIEEHVCENLSLSEISAHIGYSPITAAVFNKRLL